MEIAWRDLTETAIIAAVPAADPLVNRHRIALDPAAALGVPAHVTVLYPFVAPGALDDEVVARIAEVARQLDPVEVTFEEIGWFDRQVVYLVPKPDAWFRAATTAMHEAFPHYPPYRGAYEDVVPHLTLGDGGDLDAMRRAAEDVGSRLPLNDGIDRLLLIGGSGAPGSWRTLRELPLAVAP